MKKLAFIISIIAMGLMASCNPAVEGCTDSNSRNFNSEATQNNYDCEYSNEFYAGTWSVAEGYYSTSGCGSGNKNYNTVISPAVNRMQGTMSNFSALGNGMKPVIIFGVGKNPFVDIAQQTIVHGGYTYQVEASGHVVNDNYILLNYDMTRPGCNFSGTLDITR